MRWTSDISTNFRRAVAICAALACFGTNARAQADAAPLPADFEKNFTFDANQFGLSGRLAFTATVDGVDRIIVLDLDTKQFRKAVDLPGNNRFPVWSPDGSKLAFASDRDKHLLTYVSVWDGSDPRAAAKEHAGNEEYPAWFPDGASVIFTVSKNENESNVARVNIANGSTTMLTSFPQRNMIAHPSPDGTSIVYSTDRFWPGWDVCVFSLRNHVEKCPLNGSQSYCRADFSHSGKTLAYSYGSGNQIDVGAMTLADSNVTAVVEGDEKNYDAAWSPDDHFVMYSHQEGDGGIYAIYLSDLKSKPHRFVSSKYSLRFPSWTAARTIDLEAQRIRESEGAAPRPSPTHLAPTPEPATKGTPGTDVHVADR